MKVSASPNIAHLFPFILLLTGILLFGCERPFVEERRPDVTIISPDLDLVLTETEITIQIRAESFREVDRVQVNGHPFEYRPEVELWQGRVNLGPGVNTLIVSAEDVAQVSTIDTFYATTLEYSSEPVFPGLPQPRGAHAAALLEDGRILLTGGAFGDFAPAFRNGLYFDAEAGFTPVPMNMGYPRAGHSATTLPDGRVLIIGGSSRATPSDVVHLADEVEIFDPIRERYSTVPVGGTVPMRAYHTTTLMEFDESGQLLPFLFVYGGYGQVRPGGVPRLGLRRDMVSYVFRNDSLIAVGQIFAAEQEAISGHTATPLGSSSPDRRPHLFSGSYFFDAQDHGTVSFLMRATPGGNLDITETPAMRIPRQHHSAAPTALGAVLLGGKQATTLAALDSGELYVSELDRFFLIPSALALNVKRWGHTATYVDDARILVVGGFDERGDALNRVEWFRVQIP